MKPSRRIWTRIWSYFPKMLTPKAMKKNKQDSKDLSQILTVLLVQETSFLRGFWGGSWASKKMLCGALEPPGPLPRGPQVGYLKIKKQFNFWDPSWRGSGNPPAAAKSIFWRSTWLHVGFQDDLIFGIMINSLKIVVLDI